MKDPMNREDLYSFKFLLSKIVNCLKIKFKYSKHDYFINTKNKFSTKDLI